MDLQGIRTVFVTILLLCGLVSCSDVMIDYNSKGLTAIPVSEITPNATHIRIKNNPLGSIPNGTFAGLGLMVLHEINLENTGLSDDSVTRDSFVGLEIVRDVSHLN